MAKGSKGMFVGWGNPCPRCSKPLANYEHPSYFQPKPGKGYYRKWSMCVNDRCRTTVVFDPDEYIYPHEVGKRVNLDEE